MNNLHSINATFAGKYTGSFHFLCGFGDFPCELDSWMRLRRGWKIAQKCPIEGIDWLGWALSPVFLAMRPGSHHDLGNHCPGYIGQFIDHGKRDSGDGPQIGAR